MYALFKELHPPSVVEHCCYCNFFSSRDKNLIAAGNSQIRVFRVIDQNENEALGKDAPKDGKEKIKLEHLAQFSLFGNVTSLKAVRLGKNSRDSLLLGFRDAKLAIVEYDPCSHDLKTVSLHYFENDELKGGYQNNIHDPVIRVDPESRCAVMLVYGRHLVVLPFKQGAPIEDPDQMSQTGDSSGSMMASYTIDLLLLDHQLSNITDIRFLHGYYEPTILLLSEPVQTYSTRVAVRQDTHCIAAISLNMTEKVHPVIWSVTNLPFDCHTAVPVPKPLGGVLVFANNSLIYLNQSVPPYGVSLNSITESSTTFPLKVQEGIVLTIEGALMTFITNDKLALSLKGGELYVLTLLTDGLRSVRSFNFDKAAGSVLASCICPVGEGFLFLGSRLGNSLLLSYSEKTPEGRHTAPVKKEEGVQPFSKKRKIDPSNPYAYDDLDDLEVYGSSTEKSTGSANLTPYTFEVCDSLLNIGPCAHSSVGEPSILSEEFSGGPNPDLELVVCSGFGKNGALSVLQRSVRPQVVTTFELPGCTDMWTVFSDPKKTDGESECYHSFLILSREDSSMVLQTEAEIQELDKSGFNTQYRTVFTGNIGNNKFIIQVCPMSVRLLEGAKQIQEIPMDTGSSAIVFCSVADPHLVLMTADGFIIYGKLIEDFSGSRLKLQRPSLDKTSKISTCCMYKDTSGLFAIDISDDVFETAKDVSFGAQNKTAESDGMEFDDEDDLLYGDSSGPAEEKDVKPTIDVKMQNASRESRPTGPTYWCVICRDRGSIEIYSVPDFKLAFACVNFNNAPKVLMDSGPPIHSQNNSQPPKDSCSISEILLVGLGHNEKKPYLLAMIDQDLVVYETFLFAGKPFDANLAIRFKKLSLNILMREKTEARLAKLAEKGDMTERRVRVPLLRAFKDIASYTGVFVCGAYPHWLFVTSRGDIYAHPMNIDGAVTCFTSFHNINCPKGFLYFNKPGELRISVLPTHLTYGAPWPIRKVPLRATPYHVAYDKENKIYAVSTAHFETHKKVPKFNSEDREFETMERDSRYVYPMLEHFIIQLVSPVSWEVVPNTRYEMDEFEHITSMKMVSLKSQETHSGFKQFLVAVTTYNYGEDIASKGRMHIFDIVEVVPEPGQPLTKHKFKLLCANEQKGPVTCVCGVQGYLVTSIGQKVYVWNFKDNNDLVGMAFIDTQIYIHQMICVKNFILTADIAKSIQILRFQETHKTLSLVSRDCKPLEIFCLEYFIDGSQLGFLVCDGDQNLILFSYQPESLESYGGQRLLQKGDLNIGCHANTMFRIRVRQEPTIDLHKVKDQRQVTYLATLDGSIGLLLPMAEKTYRRLLMLQNKLIECIQHIGGLNPKAYRALHLSRRPLTNSHRNILDGSLLSKYLNLSFTERTELARKIGTKPEQILDDFMDVERATTHF